MCTGHPLNCDLHLEVIVDLIPNHDTTLGHGYDNDSMKLEVEFTTEAKFMLFIYGWIDMLKNSTPIQLHYGDMVQ